jgi:hypothetical protein
MNPVLLALILFSVSCSAVAQILLKSGMSSLTVASAMSDGQAIKIALAIGLSPSVVGGLGLYFCGAVVWLFILARVAGDRAALSTSAASGRRLARKIHAKLQILTQDWCD